MRTEIPFLIDKINELLARVEHLEKENQELKAQNAALLADNNRLRKENKLLKERTDKLLNKPHRPSGSRAPFEKPAGKGFRKKPKSDHTRISRRNPVPDRSERVLPSSKCGCGCSEFNVKDRRDRYITDLEIIPSTTRYELIRVTCKKCGKTREGKLHRKNGNSPFGTNALTLISYLKTISNTTEGAICDLFNNVFGIKISRATINNRLVSVGGKLELYHQRELKNIKTSKYTHKDETGWRVNGKTNQIWVYSDGDTTVYRFAETRSKVVLEEDFGDRTNQISINDGYTAYNMFAESQQCWAHLIRETKANAERSEATEIDVKFHERFKEIYREAKDLARGKYEPPDRFENRKYIENKLIEMMIACDGNEFLKKFCARLDRYFDQLFLFVEKQGIPSTNNVAERALRSAVINRKLSHGSKSVKAAHSYAMLKTLMTNAKARGKISLKEIEKLLTTEMSTPRT